MRLYKLFALAKKIRKERGRQINHLCCLYIDKFGSMRKANLITIYQNTAVIIPEK